MTKRDKSTVVVKGQVAVLCERLSLLLKKYIIIIIGLIVRISTYTCMRPIGHNGVVWCRKIILHGVEFERASRYRLPWAWGEPKVTNRGINKETGGQTL